MTTSSPKRPDRITTLHPQGKQGVAIDRRRYAAMRRALLAATPTRAPGVPFAELPQRVRSHLPARLFDGCGVGWYVTTVKLDLEARGLLARVPGRGPQHLVRTRGRR